MHKYWQGTSTITNQDYFGLYFAVLALSFVAQPATGRELTAHTSQQVRPVLIRNEYNPLIKLSVESTVPFVQLHSISMTLEGANNIESLAIFFAKEDGSFSSEKQYGERLLAKHQLTFSGHARLNSGKNSFWISCRLKPNADLNESVDAKEISIATSSGKIEAVDQTPHVQKRIGIALRKHWDDGVHTYRIPTLATTANGTLLCAYDMRRRKGRDLQEDIDIGLLRSIDGGRTWLPQRVIMDMGTYGDMPQEVNGVSDPGLIVDPATGEIFCFAVWMNGRPGKHQWGKDGSEPGFEIGKSAQFMMVRSTDDGQSWSTPENMTSSWKNPKWILYAPSPQQGIALNDGTSSNAYPRSGCK